MKYLRIALLLIMINVSILALAVSGVFNFSGQMRGDASSNSPQSTFTKIPGDTETLLSNAAPASSTGASIFQSGANFPKSNWDYIVYFSKGTILVIPTLEMLGLHNYIQTEIDQTQYLQLQAANSTEICPSANPLCSKVATPGSYFIVKDLTFLQYLIALPIWFMYAIGLVQFISGRSFEVSS